MGNISWLNRKDKHANALYRELLINACVMQNRMGTAMVTPVIDNQESDKNIDKQELCDYVVKTYFVLAEYKNILDKIIVQIKQQIINFERKAKLWTR